MNTKKRTPKRIYVAGPYSADNVPVFYTVNGLPDYTGLCKAMSGRLLGKES